MTSNDPAEPDEFGEVYNPEAAVAWRRARRERFEKERSAIEGMAKLVFTPYLTACSAFPRTDEASAEHRAAFLRALDIAIALDPRSLGDVGMAAFPDRGPDGTDPEHAELRSIVRNAEARLDEFSQLSKGRVLHEVRTNLLGRLALRQNREVWGGPGPSDDLLGWLLPLLRMRRRG